MKCAQFKFAFAIFSNKPLPAAVLETSEYAKWCDHMHSCEDCGEWYQRKVVEKRGFQVESFPCVHVAYHSTVTCAEHEDAWQCPDMTLVQGSDGQFGIPVRDGGSSFIVIRFCPWCGVPLKRN